MHDNFNSFFATIVLLTLFILIGTNKAHSLDVNHEHVVNSTGPKQDSALPNDKDESTIKLLGANDSAKKPLPLTNSGEGTNFKTRKGLRTSTPPLGGNDIYRYIHSRYPNMPIYLKRLLQKTYSKLEENRASLSNISQRMRKLPQRIETELKRIFSNQFPFNDHDDYYEEECCDHDEISKKFEDEMDAFNDYVEDYNDYLEDYIESLNFTRPNGSEANNVRIDIISDYPKSSGSRVIITQSDNGSPSQSKFMSAILKPNSVLEIQGWNTGQSVEQDGRQPGFVINEHKGRQSDIARNEQDGRQLHPANFY